MEICEWVRTMLTATGERESMRMKVPQDHRLVSA